jgi:DNA-binding winged helix-turn-helix (wHTH) protein
VKLRFGEFVLDTDARRLVRGGTETHLQPKTFDLLQLLVRSRPKVLSKQAIRDEVWSDVVVGEASLTVAIAELRAALGDDAKEPRYVRTVYGFGYAFAGELSEDVRDGRTRAQRDQPAPRLLWEKRVIPLLQGENVIGREEGVTVRVDAPGVSRRHARILIAGASATIEDLGSKNGTFVGEGNEPLSAPTPLADGTKLRLGRVLLVFKSSPESGSTMTEHHE